MIYVLYGLGAIALVGGTLYLVAWSAERRERLPKRRIAAGSTADEPGCGYYETSCGGGDGGGD